MYFDIVSIESITIDWTIVIVLLIVLGLMLGLALGLRIAAQVMKTKRDDIRGYMRYKKRASNVAYWAALPGFVLFVAAYVIPDTIVPAEMDTRQTAQLQSELGYENVQLTAKNHEPSTFIASDADGQYVSGSLVEFKSNSFIVVLDD